MLVVGWALLELLLLLLFLLLLEEPLLLLLLELSFLLFISPAPVTMLKSLALASWLACSLLAVGVWCRVEFCDLGVDVDMSGRAGNSKRLTTGWPGGSVSFPPAFSSGGAVIST